MKYLAEIILVLPVNIMLAWWHSRLIKAGRPIVHGLWGLLYAGLIGVAIWLLWPAVALLSHVSAFALACAAGRVPVFNIALNFFRGLSWDYMSATSTSIIDKIMLRLFGRNVRVLWAALIAVAIILQFFL
jgi:hypothetical protein